MRTWLKRMVAGIVSAGTLMGGGLLTAGTANADEIRMPDIGKTITSLTASAATTYPRELVNGGFDYLPDGGWKTVDAPSYMTNAYTSVDPNNGQYMRNAKHSDVPSDWKLDKTESGSKLVFTASKGGTAVTWTFEYQANGGSSATDPGNGGGSNAGGDGQGDPGKTPDTSKPAASPKPAGTADDGQAAGAAPLASTGAGTGPAIAVAGLLAMAGASLLAAVARTRRHGADPDGLTAD